MRDWAGAAEPIMLIEAIGGMGKSMLTWEWVTNHAEPGRTNTPPPTQPDGNGSQPNQPAIWAGRFWYSFYERGADMRDFCITALQYITRRPRADLLAQPAAELTETLLFHLHAKPYLLVLDGLERVLAAYNRSDAAQISDDEAEDSEGASGRLPTDCIRPGDDDLQLRTAAPSKVLISSRLMPRALLNRMGQPVPGVRHVRLRGLDPRDAEQMLREAGVSGDADRMRRYLDEKFAGHPLLVEIVGGLVLNDMKAPGRFDRWVDDPAGGGALNLADPDIKMRRTHILKLAFDGLDDDTRELLTRIAMVSAAVSWEVVAALDSECCHRRRKWWQRRRRRMGKAISGFDICDSVRPPQRHPNDARNWISKSPHICKNSSNVTKPPVTLMRITRPLWRNTSDRLRCAPPSGG